MGILSEIDLNSIPEIYININEFSQEYRQWIIDSDILIKKIYRFTSEGTFDSNVWFILNEISSNHLILDFRILEKNMTSGTLTNDDCFWYTKINADRPLKTQA